MSMSPPGRITTDPQLAAIAALSGEAIIGQSLDGTIRSWNGAAERLYGYSAEEMLQQPSTRLVAAGRKGEIAATVERMRRGESPERFASVHVRKDGVRIHVSVGCAPIHDEHGNLVGVSIIASDAPERDLRERRRCARLAVTQILGQSGSVAGAAPQILQSLCEAFEWVVGALWLADARTGELRCVDLWHSAAARVPNFAAATREMVMPPGKGIPGMVWATRAPVWIADVGVSENFPRRAYALSDGLHGGFGCPISAQSVVLGVIEFFSHEIREPDQDLLEMMTTLGGHLGQFIRRCQAEESLRMLNRELQHRVNELQALFTAAPVAIWVASDSQARTITGNEYANRILMIPQVGDDAGASLPPRDFKVRRGGKEIAPEDLPLHRVAATGEPIFGQDLEIVREGRPAIELICNAAPLRDEQGTVCGAVSVCLDVTAHRAAEAKLRESEQLYRAIGESIDYGVWVCDPAGRCLYVSESFLKMVGMTQEECFGLGWASALHPDDRERTIAAWNQCVRHAGRWDAEHRFLGADGKYHPTLARGLPVRDDEGRVRCWAGINLDIERLKLAEEALRESDRRKDDFLAILAHELRNPLAPIANAISVMRRPAADSHVIEQVRDMAQRQVNLMARLLDDLLDVARINRGQIELRMQTVDVADLLNRTLNAVRPLMEERGHELTVSLPARPLRIDADPLRIEQILSNLLDNAAKYTDPGGHLWLSATRQGDRVLLTVRDTGIGIVPEMLPRLFDPFVQSERRLNRSRGGLGLGLTLVKMLVDLHGGTAEARSAGLGHGSEFVVELPLSKSHAADDVGDESRSWMPTVSRRVLVVDDNRDAADSLALLLKVTRQDVRVAYDGPSSLELAREFDPELIFLDIGMPGMDGFEVARELRQRSRTVILVALTGWGQSEDRLRSSQAGFDHHVVKPVEPQFLQALLSAPRPAADAGNG